MLGIHLNDEEIDTLGGWILTQNIDVKTGTEVEVEGYFFKVHKIDGRHIQYLEVKHSY